jgi:GDSL-like Lipase/Acylhydrolase family
VRRLPRVCLRIAIGLVVVLLLLEAGLRVLARVTHQQRGIVFDEDLGWRMVPHLVKEGPQWSAKVPATTNAAGWRDAEFSRERQAGVRRVVALGDSFVFGVGVDYGERFTELMERALPGVEVLNFGANAFGTDQELRILETEALGYRPDLVLVVIFLGNDLVDIRHERRFSMPKPWFELNGGDLVLHPPRRTWDVDARMSSYLGEIALRLASGLVPVDTLAPPWAEADSLPLLAAIAARIRRAAEAAGARSLFVVTVPDWWLQGDPPLTRDVLAALAAQGCATLDLTPVLKEVVASGATAFLADGHWTPAGHDAVSRAVCREIGRLGLLP